MTENREDKVIVLSVLFVFLFLLFWHGQSLTEFLEQSCNLALGALIGLVKGSTNSKGDSK